MSKLSIVIPVYNEVETLEANIHAVRNCGIDNQELVVVDDCSSDGTTELLRESLSTYVDHVEYHDVNQGKGAALRTGIRATSGDYVVFQDADLEYDPNEFRLLLDLLESGKSDVAYGSRLLHPEIKKISPFWHRMVNTFLTLYSNFYTGLALTDMETCYKMVPRWVFDRIEIEEDKFGIEPELTAKIADLNLRVREVPVSYNRRSFEEGKKIGAKDGVRAMYVITKYGLKYL